MGIIAYYARVDAETLARARQDTGVVIGQLFDPAFAARVADVDKAWWPLRQLIEHAGAPVDPVTGGTPIHGHSPEDMLLEFTPEQVGTAAAFLSTTPASTILAGMVEVEDLAAYGFDSANDDDRAYIAGQYETLVDQYAKAAETGESIVVFFS
ncbi:DUF1877 family protein [Actinokineospora sp. G85]|uniref:DUF1877 family protein n=1 Tax=Actinokineospora sp. G85 TaxID=3406626 RepID=UPI003C74BA68